MKANNASLKSLPRIPGLLLQGSWFILLLAVVLLLGVTVPYTLQATFSQSSVARGTAALPAGASPQGLALGVLAIRTAVGALCLLTAAWLFRRRSGHGPALLASSLLVLMPLGFMLGDQGTELAGLAPGWLPVQAVAEWVSAALVLLTWANLYTFPDGRGVPEKMRLPALAVFSLPVIFLTILAVVDIQGDWAWGVLLILFYGASLLALSIPLLRYRRSRDPLERHQLLWVAVPLALYLQGSIAPWSFWLYYDSPPAGALLSLLLEVAYPAAFALAVIVAAWRHGLWGLAPSSRRPLLAGAVTLFAGTAALTLIGNRPFPICADIDPNIQATAHQPLQHVIFDGDFAHEDLNALLYLLQHPGVEVEAVTVTGTGEAHCGPGVANALGLLALHGAADIPVSCGPEAPLTGSHAFPAEWRHGADTLYGLTLPPARDAPSTLSAPELIIQVVRRSPGPVGIVAVGPLTNVGAALQAAPDIVPKLEGIYIMGGAVELGGNVGFSGVGIENPVAEWNIYIDPHAANLVLHSGAPITLVPLNATRHAPVTPEFYRCLSISQHTPEAAFVYELLSANYELITFGGFQFWDSLTAAIFTEPGLATFEERALTVVEEEGPSSGMTRPDRQGAPVRVAVSADRAMFESLFLNTLNGP
jgi:inosine-uridine nucleoside N-ribohydrolase